jgi:hypothetical protein
MYIERRESFSDLTLARWRFFDNASFEIIGNKQVASSILNEETFINTVRFRG